MTSDWLTRALEKSRARGFLGPGPIEPHIAHARGFVAAWSHCHDGEPTSFLDLGSGGGLPGLVLLEQWSGPGVLLDSMAKRVAFLREVLAEPGAPDNGKVVEGRAEDLARVSELEESFNLVVARSFGGPAVVAECAVRFLSLDGFLIVSEPPDVENRWDSAGLATLGLSLWQRVEVEAKFQVLRKTMATHPLYPRRSGVPAKRPLF